jgi:X-Pro dipeptidyl-peptidase
MPRSPSPRSLFAFVFVASVPLLTAGCVDDGPPMSNSGVGPVFEDGQAQIVEAFADTATWIREEIWVEAEFDSDGDGSPDRLHAAVVRPAASDDGLRVPVVYESSPYYSGTAGSTGFFWDVEHDPGTPPPPRGEAPEVQQRVRPGISGSHVETWVPRGFAVVHSEAPGTGLSQGCPTVGGPAEVLAPKAVIDWLNGRTTAWTAPEGGDEVVADWASGKVGMIGTSYNGTIPVAAATTGVEGLEAIVPIAPNTSYYRYYRSNGLVRNPGGYPGEDVDMLYDYVNSGDPERRAWCTETYRDGEMAEGMDRASGDYNDFWAGRDLWNDLDRIEAAVLMAHAFNDWNVMPEHSVTVATALEARGVPVMEYYHQGGHGGAPPLELVNRWFTRYLWDVENGVENDPGAWIVREDDARSEPTPYADYPHPDAAVVALKPTLPDGPEGAYSGDLVAAGAGHADMVVAFTDDVSFDGRLLATDPSAAPHRLLFTTPELVEPLHISGTARITLRMAADRPATNLSVWLVSLPWEEAPDGEQTPPTANLVTRGWADPQNRTSLAESEPLVPGEFVEVSFDLQPDDQIVPAGQRIGLMIFGSDRDFTLHAAPGTALSVDLAGTTLELPVVGGTGAFSAATGG